MRPPHPGPCGHRLPPLPGDPPHYCTRRAGHPGWHAAGGTAAQWTHMVLAGDGPDHRVWTSGRHAAVATPRPGRLVRLALAVAGLWHR